MTNRRDRARLQALIAFALALAVAACVATPVGPSTTPLRTAIAAASPTLNPNQQEAQGRTPSPTLASTARPIATSTVPPAASPSPYAPDLEALLPTELRGVPLTRYSFPSSAICEGCDFCGIVCPGELTGLATALAVDPGRIDVAVAQPDFDDPKAPKVVIVAYRVRGAPTGRLIDARIRAQQRAGLPPVGIQLQVAGKAVTWTTYGLAPTPSSMEYLFAREDVLFRVIDGVELQEGADPPGDTVLAIEALP